MAATQALFSLMFLVGMCSRSMADQTASVSHKQSCGDGKFIDKVINFPGGNITVTCLELKCVSGSGKKEDCVDYAPSCKDNGQWVRGVAKNADDKYVFKCCSHPLIQPDSKQKKLPKFNIYKTQYIGEANDPDRKHEIISNIQPQSNGALQLTLGYLKCPNVEGQPSKNS